MTQRACFRDFSSPLSGEFGRDLALKKTGLTLEELQVLMGVYKRGPRKGLIKGFVTWWKLEQGGWARQSGGGGYVAKLPISFMFSLVLKPFREPDVIKWSDGIRMSYHGEMYPEDNYPMALKRHYQKIEEAKKLQEPEAG